MNHLMGALIGVVFLTTPKNSQRWDIYLLDPTIVDTFNQGLLSQHFTCLQKGGKHVSTKNLIQIKKKRI